MYVVFLLPFPPLSSSLDTHMGGCLDQSYPCRVSLIHLYLSWAFRPLRVPIHSSACVRVHAYIHTLMFFLQIPRRPIGMMRCHFRNSAWSSAFASSGPESELSSLAMNTTQGTERARPMYDRRRFARHHGDVGDYVSLILLAVVEELVMFYFLGAAGTGGSPESPVRARRSPRRWLGHRSRHHSGENI